MMSNYEAEMKVKKYVQDSCQNLFGSLAKMYKQGDIPKKKINPALDSVAPGVLLEAIIVYADITLFGKGDDGIVITSKSFYFKDLGGKSYRIPFEKIKKVTSSEKKITIEYNDGDRLSISESYLNVKAATKFFNDLRNFHIEFSKQGISTLNDRVLTLEEMDSVVKIAYIKSIIDYEKSATAEVLSAPLAEIMGLMTQLNFTTEMRSEIKKYILAEPSPRTVNYTQMTTNTPRGNVKNIKISLLKDIIRTTRTRDKSNISTNKDILSLKTLLYLDNFLEVVKLLEKSIINDEKLIAGQISEKEYIKNLKNVTASGAAIGVPIVAIYMAGSVVGLSAAGITSGLAALGFGGLLGFSSMVTGIGFLIVSGVAVYSTVKYVTGGKQRELKTKREKMIKEVVLMHQATINNLLQDIEDYTLKINQLYQDKEANELAILELNQQMRIFKDALSAVQAKETELSSELEMV